jgi:hypothetical protein
MAIMKAQKCPIRHSVFQLPMPPQGDDSDSVQAKNSVGVLYARARALNGLVAGAADDLSKHAHGALADCRMNMYFGSQVYFWKLRRLSNKGLFFAPRLFSLYDRCWDEVHFGRLENKTKCFFFEVCFNLEIFFSYF